MGPKIEVGDKVGYFIETKNKLWPRGVVVSEYCPPIEQRGQRYLKMKSESDPVGYHFVDIESRFFLIGKAKK